MKKVLLFIFILVSLQLFPEETPENNEKESNQSIWQFNGYTKNKFHLHKDYKEVQGNSDGDDFSDFQSETMFEIKGTNYSFGLVKDVIKFNERAYDKESKGEKYQWSNDFFNHGYEQYIDKIFAKGSWDSLKISAGDFYESMNRGLMFSFKKDPVYGDNTIRGVDISTEINGFHSKAFGGKANPSLRDYATEKKMKESDDYLWGAEGGYRFGKIDFGIEYAGAKYEKYQLAYEKKELCEFAGDCDDIKKNFHLTGGYLQLNNLIDNSDIYLGGSVVLLGYDYFYSYDAGERTESRKDLSSGHALYFSGIKWFDLGANRLTISLEGKRYEKYFLNYSKMEHQDFQRRYFILPTLIWNEFQIDNEFDTMGGKAKVSFKDDAYSGLLVTGEFAKCQNLGNWDYAVFDYRPEDFYFGAVTLDRRFANSFVVLKGAIHDVSDNGPKSFDNAAIQRGFYDYKRKWIYSSLQTGGNISKFSAKLNSSLFIKDDSSENWKNAQEIAAALDFGWDNSYTISFSDTYWDTKVDGDGNIKKHYPGITAGYKYKNFRTSLFYGKIKGGLVCTGGMCRYMPDFDGIKAELDFKW